MWQTNFSFLNDISFNENTKAKNTGSMNNVATSIFIHNGFINDLISVPRFVKVTSGLTYGTIETEQSLNQSNFIFLNVRSYKMRINRLSRP